MKWKKNRGCILEVDAKYLKHLHNSHNDYPPAPEKIVIEKDMLFDYCSKIMNTFNALVVKIEKTVPYLNDKKSVLFYFKIILRFRMKLRKSS